MNDNDEWYDRYCELCGKFFLSTNYRQRFCCDGCRKEEYENNRKLNAIRVEFSRIRSSFDWVIEYDPEPFAPFRCGVEMSAVEVTEGLHRMCFSFGTRFYNKKRKEHFIVVPDKNLSKLEGVNDSCCKDKATKFECGCKDSNGTRSLPRNMDGSFRKSASKIIRGGSVYAEEVR